jgi:hypothetical protein
MMHLKCFFAVRGVQKGLFPLQFVSADLLDKPALLELPQWDPILSLMHVAAVPDKF